MRELTNISSAVLDPLLATNPSGPRITYYDDATGERIELSTATLVNWAAKTGNLLRDELGAGPGSRVAVLLPAHWQTVGILFGIWYIGAEVVLDEGDCDIACCSVSRLDEAEAAASDVVVLSLDAFGRPVAGLPFGLTDYATSVRVHGDQITAERDPGPALAGRSALDTLVDARNSAVDQAITMNSRVLSSGSWAAADELIVNMLAVFAAGASLVQVANPDPNLLQSRRTSEKVTAVLR